MKSNIEFYGRRTFIQLSQGRNMKSLPRTIWQVMRHGLHNGHMNRVGRGACALVLLLAVVSPSLPTAAQSGSSAKYPRYRLVEFPPLGGRNSGSFGSSKQLNNRGEAIAQAETTIPDPFAPADCTDCFVWHGVVLDDHGLMKDLGALPQRNGSVPIGISESGLITGLSQYGVIDPTTGSVPWQAVLWNRDRSIVNLGTLGGNCSAAYSVNSRGQVVGGALNSIPENPDFATFISVDCQATTQVRAFRWQNGSMQDLGTLGGNDATAMQVNEGGQIVGTSYTSTRANDTTGLPTAHPFLWKNGEMTDLGSLGGTWAAPGNIVGVGFTQVLNDSGEVAGTSFLAGDAVQHAFLWSNGKMIDLGTLGGLKSDAAALNNKRQVVGSARVSDTPVVRHAFLWEKGQMTDLGTVAPCPQSEAHSINAASQVIGRAYFCAGDFYETAVYVERAKPMVDLNTLIDPPSPIHLNTAWNINERGEIFADGALPDGTERAVLLVPLPPSDE
jgi:probable HAF family extracellular repeat protein